MRIVKINVCNATGLVNSRVDEDFEVEVEDDTTDKEIDKIAQEYYENWMGNFDTGVSWE